MSAPTPARSTRRSRAQPELPLDVDAARAAVEAGKSVRVRLAPSAAFPADTVGRVRSVGDPAVDGPEFVAVEVTVNGSKDVLPFAPADLRPAVRGRAGAPAPDELPSARRGRSADPAATRSASRPSAPTAGTAAPTPPRQPGPVPSTPATAPAAARPTAPPGPPSAPAPSAARTGTSSGAAGSGAGGSAAAAGPDGPTGGTRTPARRAARSGHRPTPVRITVATDPDDATRWTVDATIGPRRVIRTEPAVPARVWELVTALGHPALSEAVAAVLDEHRRATQARAAALEAELQAVRAELDQLPRPDER
ncbi:hypothetical protein [Nakamurella leprariae]|uniref:Uncharacterized protein n=1 Tax=Nakamurella leprariae TaxID=2803911 RepID=A0A939C1N7_9ACTN|nr:hypothetical protein [Nakamurella leprariae]MBM9467349.1 hypothetical protein [Nakamurella leprariae]